MKSIGMKTFGFLALAAACSHAIVGFGGQWAPAPGLKVKADKGIIVDNPGTDNDITIDQAKVEGLNGFGLKLWIDFLPFVDLEATTNFQYGYYDLAVVQGNTRVPVKNPLDVPFVDDRPVFARSVNDLTVLYPFLKLPPVVSIAKLYAGAGLTYVLTTTVLNAEMAKEAVDKAGGATTPAGVSVAMTQQLQDEGLEGGIGFHLVAGAKVKPPVIPLAAFANLKYHFLGSQPDAVDANSLTFELGGALDF